MAGIEEMAAKNTVYTVPELSALQSFHAPDDAHVWVRQTVRVRDRAGGAEGQHWSEAVLEHVFNCYALPDGEPDIPSLCWGFGESGLDSYRLADCSGHQVSGRNRQWDLRL